MPVVKPANSMYAFLGFLLAGAAIAGNSDWRVDRLATSAPVTAIRQAHEAVHLRAGSWFEVSTCRKDQLCLARIAAPAIPRPANGIPDGGIAAAGGGDIVRAWYSEPTDRYGHGVLGDRIEAGALTVVDHAGRRYKADLASSFVFEDLTPRLADIDGDGSAEVVTIQSRLDAGAAIAIYGLRGGRLIEIAATEPIGTPNRWLNIAGIADFTGDGRADIALVKTPHIGGRLEIWTFRSGSLRRLGFAEGFSNHAIGSTELGLSAIADANNDGVLDLALPDASRTALRIVTARDGEIRPIATAPVGAKIGTAIGVLALQGRPIFLIGLEDGKAIAISQKQVSPDLIRGHLPHRVLTRDACGPRR